MKRQLIAKRYEDRGLLGRGGMAEVRRVYDRVLQRTLAMKILDADLLTHPLSITRFEDEARATARLQHPSIVPLHDFGKLPDGRRWFTMKEVKGDTFDTLIMRHFSRSREAISTPRGLLESFLRVCEAVGFAHEQGIIHRDLKPQNLMVGDHGAVYVLDWGLAKSGLGAPTLNQETFKRQQGETPIGRIAGTPAFMAPEQARAEKLDARADVFSLGSVLFNLLTGHPPYRGDVQKILKDVAYGAIPEFPETVPPLLADAVRTAMAPDRRNRFPSASPLGQAIADWLSGARRAEEAGRLVVKARSDARRVDDLTQRAAKLAHRAKLRLDGVGPAAPAASKRAAWQLSDQATFLERAAFLSNLEIDQTLNAALQVDPENVDAHAMLAERFLARHRHAESVEDRKAATVASVGLSRHILSLPASHAIRVDAESYLAGHGTFALATDPPGAKVTLHRYVESERRLVLDDPDKLGKTPLRTTLAMGSYLAVIKAAGRPPVRYPVNIKRRSNWHGVPPGHERQRPVFIPPRLPEGMVFVPPGPCILGDSVGPPNALPPETEWIDGFFIDAHPVTNRQYIAFLDDLVGRGRDAEALELAPRERASGPSRRGALIYDFDGNTFATREDADGDRWDLDWPVCMIGWKQANAFARWRAEGSGLPIRLPTEREWEKAARGVDGRAYPWGKHKEPAYSHNYYAHQGRHRVPARVDSNEHDVSPYGVHGMSGNVRDWVADIDPERPGIRIARGGHLGITGQHVTQRTENSSSTWSLIGFRCACSVLDPEEFV